MKKDLEKIHEQLVHIAKETSEVSQRQYTEDDVRKLQNKLMAIDEQYKQGIIDDRDTPNLEDDPYEHQGQGQIADELAKVHNTLHMMLTRIDK